MASDIWQQIEALVESKLGQNDLFDRERCVKFLEDVGGLPHEAQTVLELFGAGDQHQGTHQIHQVAFAFAHFIKDKKYGIGNQYPYHFWSSQKGIVISWKAITDLNQIWITR